MDIVQRQTDVAQDRQSVGGVFLRVFRIPRRPLRLFVELLEPAGIAFLERGLRGSPEGWRGEAVENAELHAVRTGADEIALAVLREDCRHDDLRAAMLLRQVVRDSDRFAGGESHRRGRRDYLVVIDREVVRLDSRRRLALGDRCGTRMDRLAGLGVDEPKHRPSAPAAAAHKHLPRKPCLCRVRPVAPHGERRILRRGGRRFRAGRLRRIHGGGRRRGRRHSRLSGDREAFQELAVDLIDVACGIEVDDELASVNLDAVVDLPEADVRKTESV